MRERCFCNVLIYREMASRAFSYMPWAIMALATFMKPATLAPFT